MNRILALFAAVMLSAVTVTSAVANEARALAFMIEPSSKSDQLKVEFKRSDRERSNAWSSAFQPSQLHGLNLAALRSSGTSPIRFSVTREAGRIDCVGTGGNSRGSGRCKLAPDSAFNDYLVANGIARPNADQAFGLVALDVKRELVAALKAVDYPTPRIDDLVALTAIGVTPDYVRGLAGQGYRPGTLHELVQFGALKITPEYIGSFTRAGYSDLRANELVQMRALGITADYVAGFDRIGYGRLPVNMLVQMKALDVTPDFARSVREGAALPSPDRLVMLRALGHGRR